MPHAHAISPQHSPSTASPPSASSPPSAVITHGLSTRIPPRELTPDAAGHHRQRKSSSDFAMAALKLLVLAASVLSAAAYNRPESSKDFRDLDKDESGHVDRAEVDAHLDRQFDVSAAPAISPIARRANQGTARCRPRPAHPAPPSRAGRSLRVDGILRRQRRRPGDQG